jgi:SPP1 family phage portal protein
MKIQEILDKYGEDFNKLTEVLCKDKNERDIETAEKEFTGDHVILQRPVKMIGKGATAKKIEQSKLVIQFQKKIVNMAVAFLFGEPVNMVLNNEETSFQGAFDLLQDVWNKNKLKFFNKKLARRLFVETKVAELWYTVFDAENNKHLKVSLLSKKNGDDIYAHFNENGDMDAFTRRYKLEDISGKTYEHTDIYTADKIIYGVKKDSWELTEEKNLFEKIPVIYYEQERPEWADVQTEIDRAEMLISKFADTNDYFGSPMLMIKGKVLNAPDKEEVGKLLQFTGEVDPATGKRDYGDADYLTWEQAPESVKQEYDILKDIIYSMTATPDLSLSNVKGLTKTSGEALKFLFLDSILKAKDKEEIFGEAITRRINLLKAMLAIHDVSQKEKFKELDISVNFGIGGILPDDSIEKVKALSVARGGDSIMSQEEAVRQNPLVTDAEEDIKRLETEKSKSEINSLGESFDV